MANKKLGTIEEMEFILSGKTAAPAPPVLVQDHQGNGSKQAAAPVTGDKAPAWLKKSRLPAKTTVRRCIVIDKDDHWHQEAQVDLKGIDATEFEWGYYGQRLPVLIESKEKTGLLLPFHLPDEAGENSNLLFKGANPDAFKARFRHKSSLLTKIQVGLMVALVLGLFFIMFILINQ